MARSSTGASTIPLAAVLVHRQARTQSTDHRAGVPYSYTSSAELLETGERCGLKIHQIVFANELTWRDAGAIRAGIQKIWDVMERLHCARSRNRRHPARRPRVRRRAPGLRKQVARERHQKTR